MYRKEVLYINILLDEGIYQLTMSQFGDGSGSGILRHGNRPTGWVSGSVKHMGLQRLLSCECLHNSLWAWNCPAVSQNQRSLLDEKWYIYNKQKKEVQLPFVKHLGLLRPTVEDQKSIETWDTTLLPSRLLVTSCVRPWLLHFSISFVSANLIE